MPQRLRRVGTASAAVSAGALVLLLSAPAAEAAEVCKKGVDPETTIENWKCNLGNIREALTPKTPTPTPEPTPSKTAPKKTTSSKSSGNKTSKAPAKKTRKPSSAPSGGGAAAPPPVMTDSTVSRPLTEKAPSTATGLPGVLPTPEIAADPNAHRQNPPAGTAAMPQTRLISPVAASQQDNGQLLLVAAAAGAAGAAGALNLSVAGRTRRRRRTTR
ncbi:MULTISPECIES: hypothetical protein [unclassified Spirillospora]|uniref:hypothetical protein n=1 Tax=unclassified Spirillospora TaxID=2642701 RepID=UPI0037217456